MKGILAACALARSGSQGGRRRLLSSGWGGGGGWSRRLRCGGKKVKPAFEPSGPSGRRLSPVSVA